MKYLIILNRKYPYKYGEAFLENEVDEISGAFDKIYIFPSDMTYNDPITREIKSQNVEVNVFESTSLKMRNIKYSICGLFETKENSARSLKEKLYCGYFNSAARIQAQKIWNILKYCDFKEEDEVILYSYWLFINAKVAVLLKKKLQRIVSVKCVSRAHAFDIYEDRRYLPAREYLLANLDAVYPCSQNGTQFLKKRYPDYADKVVTSYLGTYDRGKCLKNKETEFRIVSCSRIAAEKRIGFMIDTFKYLRESNYKISWTHFGGGEQLDELKIRAANELDFMKVTFTGVITNAQVYENYLTEHFDMFLNTSSAEGLPVSIMEAISFGIPVVATNVGGTSEIVIDGVSGKLVDKDITPKELARVIGEIIELPDEEYYSLSCSARALWEKKFQATNNYAKFAEQILNL